MSLKAFHLVFIAASILMSVFVGAWGVGQYRAGGGGGAMTLSIGSFLLGGVLAVYGVSVYRKLQALER